MNLIVVSMLDCKTLKSTDRDRLFVQGRVNASAFAVNFGWTRLSARQSENIRIENRFRRTFGVPIRNSSDELRNIDSGRASVDARSIVAVDATVTLGDCFSFVESRLEVGELAFES